MTITPSHILECANSLAALNGTLTEDIDRLEVAGEFSNELLDQWRVIASEATTHSIGTVTAIDSVGDDIDLDSADISTLGGTTRIRVKKTPTDSTYYFFTAKGMISLLSNADRCSHARIVLIAESFKPFQTESCHFGQWITPVADDLSPNPMASVIPRRLVKDMIGGFVPLSIGPFLLVGEALSDSSSVFCEWRSFSIRQLLACLASEVWDDNGTVMVTLHGPRTRKVEADFESANAEDLHFPLTECARWVYASGRDIEVRHTLMTYELAREWPDNLTWAKGFSVKATHSLDAAKTAFHAHIRETSKETLKSLGDLRKTLGEDVARVSQQTRDLLSTLWRDFAVAVTAVVARVVLILAEKPSSDSIVVKGILVSIAGFLIFSLIFTLRSNSRFMTIADDNRKVWRNKLYGFLPDDDIKALSDDPLQQSTAVYRKATRWVIGAYVLATIAILATAFVPHDSTVGKRTEIPSKAPQSTQASVPATAPIKTIAKPSASAPKPAAGK